MKNSEVRQAQVSMHALLSINVYATLALIVIRPFPNFSILHIERQEDLVQEIT